MRASFAAASLAALAGALIASTPAAAQDNQITCGRFERAVARAATAAALQEVIRAAPSQQDCPATHAQAERKRAGFQGSPPSPPVAPPTPPPQQPAIVRSPPPPPLPAADQVAFNRVQRENPTCEGWRGYLAVFGSGGALGRRASAERDRLCPSSTTGRTSAPPPPPPAPTLTDGQTFRDCADCPEMVVIPAGSFVMGSPAGEASRGTDEGPQRPVSISRFAAGKFEVTFDEWAACVAGGGCRSNANPSDQGWGRSRRPVINVSWNDAQEYVQWLSQKTGQRYRLLTEAEWEYATRGKTNATANEPAFWWGNSIRPEQAQYWWSSSYNGSPTRSTNPDRTVPVGSFQANPFGLHDVHGNVWEWTRDCHKENYSGLGTMDPLNDVNPCSSRVLRGGSWVDDPRFLRSAYRSGYNPAFRLNDVGFRLARTVSPPVR